MPGPADERIQRYLAQRAAERAAAQKVERQVEREGLERKELAERVLQKWRADIDVITSILRELTEKLAVERPQFGFSDGGPSGNAIATGIITGRFSGKNIDFALKVAHDGTIELSSGRLLGPDANLKLVSTTRISVLTANKGEYEAVILDLLGVD
jgi:hypothetical protein